MQISASHLWQDESKFRAKESRRLSARGALRGTLDMQASHDMALEN
jgi:hypothetical protein